MDDMTKRNLLIIWFSMLSTQVIFVAVASQAVPPAPAPDPVTWKVVAATAALPTGMSLAWGRVVARDAALKVRWLVRWASAEAVGLLGLVTGFLGAPDVAVGALLGLGFLLTLLQFPRDER